ncbi:hypothetical protein [Aeromonas aquatica]|uniref:hypothetical protein n=1 Tax=Aeromonas aquatica TaxID=558964 RepID=UPI00286F2088|nr:hypothetical protein [Aeromonas aquatica]
MTLSTSVTDLSLQFRLGLSTEAALELPTLMKRLLPLWPTLTPTTQQQLPRIMSAMLACQEQGDWLGLADWLEYELVQLLNQDAESQRP